MVDELHALAVRNYPVDRGLARCLPAKIVTKTTLTLLPLLLLQYISLGKHKETGTMDVRCIFARIDGILVKMNHPKPGVWSSEGTISS